MTILEIILIGIGLAMDTFAVAICKGLAMKKFNKRKTIIIGLYFALFQALMPVLGYYLGTTFSNIIQDIDHWAALTLLGAIGINMIKESFSNEEDNQNDKVDFKNMIGLAIATSIDALAVGITFAFLKTNLLLAVSVIGIITFSLSVIGVKIGNRFGNIFQNKAEFLGGIILILIGLKILLEHIGIINL